MLVFDLERQNRALCELFQQKLPNHPTAHYQVTNSVSSLFRQKNTEYVTRNNRVYEISVAALYFCCRLHKAQPAGCECTDGSVSAGVHIAN